MVEPDCDVFQMHCRPEPEPAPHVLLFSQYLPIVMEPKASQVVVACAGVATPSAPSTSAPTTAVWVRRARGWRCMIASRFLSRTHVEIAPPTLSKRFDTVHTAFMRFTSAEISDTPDRPDRPRPFGRRARRWCGERRTSGSARSGGSGPERVQEAVDPFLGRVPLAGRDRYEDGITLPARDGVAVDAVHGPAALSLPGEFDVGGLVRGVVDASQVDAAVIVQGPLGQDFALPLLP